MFAALRGAGMLALAARTALLTPDKRCFTRSFRDKRLDMAASANGQVIISGAGEVKSQLQIETIWRTVVFFFPHHVEMR